MKNLLFKVGDLVLVTATVRMGKATVIDDNPERYANEPNQIVQVQFMRTGDTNYFRARDCQLIAKLPETVQVKKDTIPDSIDSTNTGNILPENFGRIITGYNP